jgi:hypothetical protein
MCPSSFFDILPSFLSFWLSAKHITQDQHKNIRPFLTPTDSDNESDVKKGGGSSNGSSAARLRAESYSFDSMPVVAKNPPVRSQPAAKSKVDLASVKKALVDMQRSMDFLVKQLASMEDDGS